MIVFPLPGHRALLPPGSSIGRWALEAFPDGELQARLKTPVRGRDCAALGSVAPPDRQTLSTLLLGHALRRAGARTVLALLPYLGYGRQDRAGDDRSLGAAWIGSLLAASGFDAVVTVDVHSRAAAQQLGLPVTSLSPARLFAAALPEPGRGDLSIVAPDEGAIARCTDLAQVAGIAAPVAHLRKRRNGKRVAHGTLVGDVAPRVTLVDDILDTGATLLSACRVVREAGVTEISIMATHGTFSGRCWEELPAAGVRRIVVTDTVPDARARSRGIADVVSVASLLGDAVKPGTTGRRP